MSCLLIDSGNTRLKYTLFENNQIAEAFTVDYESNLQLSELISCFDKLATFSDVYISNVAGRAVENILKDFFEQRGITCQFATSQKSFGGLVNAYVKADQLGVDRWLSMIAVTDCFSGAFCVADCGTAITIDAVGIDGKHKGGVILPGLSLMRSAINANTDAIEIERLDENVEIFGKTTQQAVSAGINYAAAVLIKTACETLEKEASCNVSCILTGGDAEFLQGYLSIPSVIETNLVFKGLVNYFGLTQ